MILSYNKIEIEPHCDQLEKEQTPETSNLRNFSLIFVFVEFCVFSYFGFLRKIVMGRFCTFLAV